MDEQRDPNTPEIGRRRLLRRAGGVAAGVAGATVVGAAVMPQAASAASGDSMTIGVATNDAGTNGTTLTTDTGSASTLELANTNVTPTVLSPTRTIDSIGAPLRLVPAAASAHLQVVAWDEVGSMAVDSTGTLWLCAAKQTADWVYTTSTANQLVPVTPTRILDTRNSAGSASILDATGNVDSQGRVLPGHAITVDLSSLVFFGTAVYANLTVVTPAASGFASLVPGNQVIVGEPATSNVNFVAGDVVPNFALTAITKTTGLTPGSTDAVKVFSTSLAHIVLDVFAFTVGDPGQVNPTILPSAMTGSGKAMAAGQSRAEQARTRKPTWSK